MSMPRVSSLLLDVYPCHNNEVQDGECAFVDLESRVRPSKEILKFTAPHPHDYRSRRRRTFHELKL